MTHVAIHLSSIPASTGATIVDGNRCGPGLLVSGLCMYYVRAAVGVVISCKESTCWSIIQFEFLYGVPSRSSILFE